MMIKVAVVEDHGGFRETVVSLLDETGDVTCVAACPDARSALADLPALAPDVVLMDLHLPGENGIECVGRLKERLPRTQIIMLTIEENSRLVLAALRSGASGYVLKARGPGEVLRAIREAYAGGSPMSAPVARMVVRSLQQTPDRDTALGQLTPKEIQVLDALVKGFSNKEIANALGLSEHTVRTHVRNIFEKLRVHSRTEATAVWYGRKES